MAGGIESLTERMASALRSARRLLAQERSVFLLSYCVKDARGRPDRQSMERGDAAHIRSYDRAIAKIDEALE